MVDNKKIQIGGYIVPIKKIKSVANKYKKELALQINKVISGKKIDEKFEYFNLTQLSRYFLICDKIIAGKIPEATKVYDEMDTSWRDDFDGELSDILSQIYY